MPRTPLIVLLGFVLPPLAAAQSPSDSIPVLVAPQQVLTFARGDSTVFEDPAMGRAFRYQGVEERFDVYIYPAGTGEGGATRSPEEILAEETRVFMETLPEGVRRGWYEAFRRGSDEAHDLTLAGVDVPGRLATVAFRSRQRVLASSFYVFHVRGQLVKVRNTIPAERLPDSQSAAFTRGLVEALLGSP